MLSLLHEGRDLLQSYVPLGSLGFIAVSTAVVLAVLAAAVAATKRPAKAASARVIHRPASTLPFLENTLDFARRAADIHDWMSEQSQQFNGEPWLVKVLGLVDMLILGTPEAFEDVMKTHFDKFDKNAQAEILVDIVGEAIFAVDGAKWLHQRKIASNLFTKRALRDSMAAVVQKHIVPLHEIFIEARDNGTPIDLSKLMASFTLQAFAEIGFGIEMDCLTPGQVHPFQDAFDGVTRSVMTRLFRPRWFWRLQRWLGVGEEGKTLRYKKVIDKIGMEVMLNSIKARRSGSKKDSKDVISLFLDSSDENPDMNHLKNIVLAFLFAGRDTTSQTLFWFFVMLSRHPEVERKVRVEIKDKLPQLFNSTVVGAAPSMEEVEKLPYLEATIKESLRLNPVVPLNDRSAMEDLVLRDGTFVKKGTRVIFPSYALGRSKNVWGPDADEFKPERWIDPTTGSLIQVSPFKFPVFHGGPRLCLGINLAMLEMKIVASSLLSKFHISVLPNQTVTYDIAPTISVKGVVLMGVTSADGSADEV
ncbi:Cytochrome p450 86a2 [Globisporangium polare]